MDPEAAPSQAVILYFMLLQNEHVPDSPPEVTKSLLVGESECWGCLCGSFF